MQRSDLKRPRYFIPIGLVLALVVASAVIFNPAFQKKMLLQYAGPLVDSLEISYIHFTPWSIKLDKLAVGYKGGHFQIGDGRIRYCLSSLLLMKLNLKSLALQDVIVDLTGFNPPDTPAEIPEKVTGPFPGVLASLQHGLGYELQALNINARVVLADEQSVSISMSGGGIKPKASGAIYMDVRFDTGKQKDHIDLAGTLRFDQTTRGRFSAIQTTLDLQAALASLPEVERMNANLIITPESDSNNHKAAEDNGSTYVQPESIHLSLLQKDNENNTRSSLKLNGLYNGNNGDFTNGRYRITANERLIQRYASEKVLPPTQEMLSGKLNFNIADLTGNITIISDLLMTDLRKTQSNEQLPELLRLKNYFQVSLLTGHQLRIEKLDTGLSDNHKTQPLAANLPADLNIPLDHIDSFLHQENTLLEFTLPAVPLKWLDVFLPEQNITAGQLTAAFQITTDTSSAIHLKPLKPLEIQGLTITRNDAALINNLNLSVLPTLTYSGDKLDISLAKLLTSSGKQNLATGYLKAALPLSEEQTGAVKAQANINLNTRSLLHLLAIKQTGKQTLPGHLSLDFQTDIRQQSTSIVVNKLDATLTKGKNSRLLKLNLQQPLTLETGEAGVKFKNPAGTLATLNITDIQLGWFSSFLPDTTLKGKLHSTDFMLAMNTKGVATIRSTRPFKINNVTVTDKSGPLLKDLGIRLLPVIRLAPDSTGISYRNLAITGNKANLLTGKGHINLPAKAGKSLFARGQLNIDLQRLSKQPFIAKLLQAEIVSPVRFEANYKLVQGKTRIDISKLSASLFYSDDVPKASLQADSQVRIRTRLSGKQSASGRASGKVTLVVDDLTPEPFTKILAANGLKFTKANGKAVLNSNGKLLNITTLEPFVINGLEVNSKDAELLQAFTLIAGTATTLQGNTLHTKLAPFTINFDQDKQSHAIDGRVDLTLKGSGDNTQVDTLNANLTMILPPILDQPAIMPGHTLTAGKLTSVTTVNSSGKFDSTTRIQELKSKQDLPLQLLEIKVAGQVGTDGSFDLTAPIKTVGKTGESDLLIKAAHSTRQAANNDIAIDINSTVLYLNDILNTLKAIAGEQAEEKETGKEKIAEAETDPALELQADKRAFWDTLPYNFHTTTHIKRLFYTDYLEIYNIKGGTDFTPTRLSLNKVEAYFRDNPITLDGGLSFTPGEVPYDLKLQAGAEKFDLATFSRELDPEAIPRAEGLFNVKVKAFGKSPNMAQYRNQLFFDMHMQSRDGIFRLLNPNSAVIQGTTGFAGVLGEGVSFVPTGLFGLGAVSRLVNYIKSIDYTKIDIHLARGESRDVQIKEYVVQNREILMTAEGGIRYQPGIDIMHSPLSLEAQLNLRSKGAAIFYDMDLLELKKDAYGYWTGPAIKFWGTPAKSESNLGDIITAAGKGMFFGGITRPISGLIGNFRHRLFGDNDEPLEFKGGSGLDLPD